MSPWRKWARNIRTEYKALLRSLVDESLENSKRPNAPDCFLQHMMRNQDKTGLDDEHVSPMGGRVESISDTSSGNGPRHVLTFQL